MKRKKLIAAAAIASVLIFGFTGCTSGSGKPGGSSTISNPWWSTTGVLDKDGEGNVVFDDVEIKLTTVVNGEDLTRFNQIISEFNAEYRGQISVEVTSVNQSTFAETVSKQISNNNNPPDLIMTHQKELKQFANNKLVQPFDEIMETSGLNISMADYSTGLSQYADLGFEGYTFGIPVDAQSCVVYYNKQILAKYGGELPNNRSELLALCASVKQGENIAPIAWSTTDDGDFFTSYLFPTAIMQNGGHFYNSDYRADWYDDKDNLQAFKDGISSIGELISLGYAGYNTAEATALSNFLNNKALFYVSMPWYFDSIIEAYGTQNGNLTDTAVMSDRIGGTTLSNWFALDDDAATAGILFGDSHSFAISKTVTDVNKKAAIVEFSKWFTETSSVGIEWAEAGHISASTTILNSNEYNSSDFVVNYISQWYPDINKFECPGNTPYYSDTFSYLKSLFVDTYNKTQSQVESAIKTAQDNVNGIIDFIEM